MILREESLRRPESSPSPPARARHALLLEGDDEQIELAAGNLLRLDVDHATDAMGRIDHEIALLRGEFLRLGHCLLRLGHIKSLHIQPRVAAIPRPATHAPLRDQPDVRYR